MTPLPQVMRLESAEDIEKGRQALLSLRALLEEKGLLTTILLQLQNLSHFRRQAHS